MTIKQVVIGTVLGTTVIGLTVMRLRKDRTARPTPTQVASVNKIQVHKRHAAKNEGEQSSRKILG